VQAPGAHEWRMFFTGFRFNGHSFR
jgi:hypothetical protein